MKSVRKPVLRRHAFYFFSEIVVDFRHQVLVQIDVPAGSFVFLFQNGGMLADVTVGITSGYCIYVWNDTCDKKFGLRKFLHQSFADADTLLRVGSGIAIAIFPKCQDNCCLRILPDIPLQLGPDLAIPVDHSQLSAVDSKKNKALFHALRAEIHEKCTRVPYQDDLGLAF